MTTKIKTISFVFLTIGLIAITAACKKENVDPVSTTNNNGNNGNTNVDTCWYQQRIVGNWQLELFRVTGSPDYIDNSLSFNFGENGQVEVVKNNYLGETSTNTFSYSFQNYERIYDGNTVEESADLIIGNDEYTLEGIYRTNSSGGSEVFGPYSDDKLELVDLSLTISDSIYAWHFLRQ